MRPKPVILLQALLDGREVEMDGRKYAMSESGDLCMIPESGLAEGLGLMVEMDISHFCQIADRMTDDQITILSMNNAMNAIKKSRRG